MLADTPSKHNNSFCLEEIVLIFQQLSNNDITNVDPQFQYELDMAIFDTQFLY